MIAASWLLFAASAAAQDSDGAGALGKPGPWAAAARTSYTYLGPRERPTGGLMITADVARALAFGMTTVELGADLSVFGFDSGGRWAAILGGPTGRIRAQTPWEPLSVDAGAHLDAGRLPTCSRWGFCLLYSGLFPAFTAGATYAPSERVSFDLSGGVRIIRTLGWSGLGGQLGFAGTVRF